MGNVPPSLLGSMKKIDWETLTTSDAYTHLINLLRASTPEGRIRRRALEQINGRRLSDDLLQVVEVLDLALLTPIVATQINNAAESHRLNARLAVIRRLCSTATYDALRTLAEALGSRFNSGQHARS